MHIIVADSPTFLRPNVCEKLISFCQILKKTHTKENWFLFSASRCTSAYPYTHNKFVLGVVLRLSKLECFKNVIIHSSRVKLFGRLQQRCGLSLSVPQQLVTFKTIIADLHVRAAVQQ